MSKLGRALVVVGPILFVTGVLTLFVLGLIIGLDRDVGPFFDRFFWATIIGGPLSLLLGGGVLYIWGD